MVYHQWRVISSTTLHGIYHLTSNNFIWRFGLWSLLAYTGQQPSRVIGRLMFSPSFPSLPPPPPPLFLLPVGKKEKGPHQITIQWPLMKVFGSPFWLLLFLVFVQSIQMCSMVYKYIQYLDSTKVCRRQQHPNTRANLYVKQYFTRCSLLSPRQPT